MLKRFYIFLSILLVVFFGSAHSTTIEFGLPDSLSGADFWNSEGEFMGLSESSVVEIPAVLVFPESDTVDHLDGYDIDFIIPASGIPRRGGMSFRFPDGFDLNEIRSIEYSDNHDGDDLEIRFAFIFNQTILLFFKPGQSPPGGTTITITLNDIRNPQVAGDYTISGLIFNKWLMVTVGPTTSQPFTIYPDEPVALFIAPNNDSTVQAGEIIKFEAYGEDQFGNRDYGLDFVWSLATEYDDIGLIEDGTLLAKTVGTGQVVASYGGLEVRSGLVTVVPGAVRSFVIEEYPLTVQAGDIFPSPVVVSVLDGYNNLKTDYTGEAYFESSDPLAELVYNENNKYIFTPDDSGRKSFGGEYFIFHSVGSQVLRVTDGNITGKTGAIYVEGDVEDGDIVSFNADFPATVTAGSKADILISSAVDSGGNAADGIVYVELIEGGVSPDGYEPITNNILIQNGEGSAGQYMFETGLNVLRLGSGEFFVDIEIEVTPSIFNDLSLDIQSTQFVGNAFVGEAAITAFDRYGNIKSDFDASINPVTIEVDSGDILPAILDNGGYFIDGVADLGQLGVLYEGSPGSRVISIRENSDIYDDASVIFNGIGLETHSSRTARIGEPFPAFGTLTNPGNQTPFENIRIEFYFNSCFVGCLDSLSIDPLEPDSSEFVDLMLETDPILADMVDSFTVIVSTEYVWNSEIITVQSEEITPVAIEKPAILNYVESSFKPDSILSPSFQDEFSAIFIVETDFEMPVHDVYGKIFISIDGEEAYRIGTFDGPLVDDTLFVLLQNVVIPPDLLSDIGAGSYALGIEGLIRTDRGYYFSKDDFDSVLIGYPSELSYVSNSLGPMTLPADTGASFTFDVDLIGTTAIKLNHDFTKFELLYDGGQLSASLDSGLILFPGTNRIHTQEIFIPTSLKGTELTPRIVYSGMEFNDERSGIIEFGLDRVIISNQTAAGPTIAVLSTELITVNSPFVNTEQEFEIAVTVGNLSDTDVDSVAVFILSEDGMIEYGTSVDNSIPANDSITVNFSLTAPEFPAASVIYKAVVSAPDEVDISDPIDNIAAVTVQTPAQIELSYDLNNTSNGFVDYEQPFSITAQLLNVGDASASLGEVTLFTGTYDFGIPDSTALELEIGTVGEWNLVAPAASIIANLILRVTEIPIDLNTGMPAQVIVEEVSILITVELSTAELVVSGMSLPSPLVVEGETQDIFRLDLRNETVNPLNIISVRTILLHATDKFGNTISPTLVLDPEQSGFYSNGSKVASGSIESGRLKMTFDKYTLVPDERDSLIFRTTFNDPISIDAFNLSIDSRDIRAIFSDGPRINQSVPVVGEFESSFRIGANFVVVQPSIGNSLTIRNNPFNPDEGPAEIAYVLTRDTKIEMKIYTATGNEVFEKTYPAGSNGGMAGDNYIEWDGCNDDGQKVLNGVYIVVINPSGSDDTYKLKIAVMK